MWFYFHNINSWSLILTNIVSVLHQISRAEGIDSQFLLSFGTDILLIINPSTGMDQKIHPCGQARIDSVKINPSPLRMWEWVVKRRTCSTFIVNILPKFIVNILLPKFMMSFQIQKVITVHYVTLILLLAETSLQVEKKLRDVLTTFPRVLQPILRSEAVLKGRMPWRQWISSI